MVMPQRPGSIARGIAKEVEFTSAIGVGPLPIRSLS